MDIFIQFFNDESNLLFIYLLFFIIILGFEVIFKVFIVFYMFLMLGVNVIFGVVIIGVILFICQVDFDDYLILGFGFLGVIFGMVNVAGGFVVIDCMLEMFKKKK